MNIQISSIKLNLITSVGTLSQKKEKFLDGLFLKGYPQKQNPINQAVVYINPQQREAILIGPNQISFSIQGQDLTTDNINSCWRDKANSVADILMLDNKCNAYEIEIQGLVEACENNKKAAATKSIHKFSSISHQRLKQFGEFTGIGLRFMLKNDNLMLENRVEPFMGDQRMFFLALNAKVMVGDYHYDVIFQDFERMITYYSVDWFNFIKEELFL